MKQVLLIDDSSVFRDYLKSKLESKHVAMAIGVGPLDSLSKMRNLLPDLVVIDFNSNRKTIFDLLEQKREDPNARDLPVIALAQNIEKEELSRLSAYGVKRVIPKPLKIDQFFSAVTETLRIEFDIDTTACILEARVNDNIIFIEIAQGLNREKIDLLKYRIRELIALYNLVLPKVLVMMTDLSLSFIDGPNMELLMDSILADTGVRNRNVKILTLDPFARDFIEGNKDYAEIQVVTDLSRAIDSLLKDVDAKENAPFVISERILSVNEAALKDESSLEMRFKSELEALKSVAQSIRIAVVDDDIVIRGVLAKTFQAIHAEVDQFEDGIIFISDVRAQKYDVIFLDLIMPGMNGFEVLKRLRENGITTPIIVLSAVSQREAVLKVLSAGVKSYMIKPLRPEAVLKKTIEVLAAI